MGCKLKCIINQRKRISKCCLECEKYEECTALCDDLDLYEFTENCPNYVKEDED